MSETMVRVGFAGVGKMGLPCLAPFGAHPRILPTKQLIDRFSMGVQA